MAVRNVFTGRQMRQHARPAAADAGFCLKFFPSASRPDKRGSRYAALTAAAAAAWLSLYPWAEAQADDAPSYTEIDQYHGEFSTKDGGTFSYLPDAGKFEGPDDKPVTPTGTDAPHNYHIELNGTHLTATGTDSSGLNPSELRILNSDEGTVSTNKLTYYQAPLRTRLQALPTAAPSRSSEADLEQTTIFSISQEQNCPPAAPPSQCLTDTSPFSVH